MDKYNGVLQNAQYHGFQKTTHISTCLTSPHFLFLSVAHNLKIWLLLNTTTKVTKHQHQQKPFIFYKYYLPNKNVNVSDILWKTLHILFKIDKVFSRGKQINIHRSCISGPSSVGLSGMNFRFLVIDFGTVSKVHMSVLHMWKCFTLYACGVQKVSRATCNNIKHPCFITKSRTVKRKRI